MDCLVRPLLRPLLRPLPRDPRALRDRARGGIGALAIAGTIAAAIAGTIAASARVATAQAPILYSLSLQQNPRGLH